MGKCTGQCCEAIGIYVGPFDLRRSFIAWCRGKKDFRKVDGHLNQVYLDIGTIYPMFRYVGASSVHPASGNPIQMIEEGKLGKKWFVYSCKHFDREKRICKIYDKRPEMCRSYPDGTTCKFKGCGYNTPVELTEKSTEQRKKNEQHKQFTDKLREGSEDISHAKASGQPHSKIRQAAHPANEGL